MKEQNHAHLQEGQILWAVIDEKELAGDKRQHLLECPECKKRVAHIRAELQEFGAMAREAVPPMVRPVKLPGHKPAAAGSTAGWLPFFAAAAMAGFVVFFYFAGMETPPPVQLTPVQTQESLLEDEFLMQEIADLVEDPLSDEMYEITGEDNAGFEDDFIEFVVPDTQDDFQSELIIQGGIKRC